MSTDVGAAFLAEARRSFTASRRQAEGALAQVRDDDLFREPAPGSNSIAVLLRHLAGNMRSRFTEFLTSDGEKPDRNRDGEFERPASGSRVDLMKEWEDGWRIVFEALDGLTPEDVLRTVTIRGEPHTVLEALSRQETHYAQHVGQIIALAKQFQGPDWKTLSIPRGASEEFNRRAREERRPRT